jgi:hypothetical protein
VLATQRNAWEHEPRDTFTRRPSPTRAAQLAHDLPTVDLSLAETVMAELSPHNALINDQSAINFPHSAGLHESHLDSESAVTGETPESAHHLPPPHDSETVSLDPNSSHDHGHLNSAINRDLDNATPDQQGSDTDSSRPDASKGARSGSVKKPLSFKPVSITKSFLAKSATTPGSTPPPVKVAEKRTPTAPNSPRLVLTPRKHPLKWLHYN